MKQRGAYIYTRVSTAIQTEGFSLDAQRQRILEAAKYMHLRICGEYSDAGYSGKNIAGRLQFQQMLDDIAAKKDDVQYVLVFKLSRFGRNTADVLSSLQFMQDYGVNLFCVEDNIDSAADSGKLLISVMSAVAEIERENILVQSMSGRKNKASKGGWNGGKAPYGYELQNGQLQVVEDEIAVIRDTFDLYISTNKGAGYVASELNRRYTKKVKHPSDTNKFTVDFVKRVVTIQFIAVKLPMVGQLAKRLRASGTNTTAFPKRMIARLFCPMAAIHRLFPKKPGRWLVKNGLTMLQVPKK